MKTPKSLICSLHSILRFRQVLVITNQETHLVWETVRCDSHVEESNIGTAFAVRRTGGATGINSGFCCSQITGATPLLRSPLRSHLRHRRGLQGHFIPSFTSIIASHLRFPLLLLKVLNRSRGCGYVILHWKLWTNAAVIVAAMWFWRLRNLDVVVVVNCNLKPYYFVSYSFSRIFFLVCLRFGLWFRWSDEILTLRSSLSFGFIHGCGDSWMWRMRPQLWLWFGFGDSENFDVAATIAVAERNLKPC